MATQTTQILPPGYVDQLGASFANYTTGVSDIKDSPILQRKVYYLMKMEL